MKQQIKEIPPFSFDESSDLPMWVQLRNRMAYLITSGFYKPGEKLPTVRKYAAELRIAYNTVSKAYMGLERDGYVTTVRGSGVFVNDPDAILKPAPEVDALVEEFVKGCLENGMAYDDIPKMVSSCVRRMMHPAFWNAKAAPTTKLGTGPRAHFLSTMNCSFGSICR